MDVRINVRRLFRSLWLSLILPMGIALLLDWQLGFFPWLTIGASVIFIPLATVFVIRAALSEIDQMIQELAPLEPTPNDRHELG
jgi:uncharacterized membrane protein YgaE (UPF0421/DUF939 family)